MPKTKSLKTPNKYKFLSGGGKVQKLILDRSYSDRDMLKGWSQSLQTTLSIVLNSTMPMFLMWGEKLICFFNDAFCLSSGNKISAEKILGIPVKEALPGLWQGLEPIVEELLLDEAFAPDKYPLIQIENLDQSFCCSPVIGESGIVEGILLTVSNSKENNASSNKSGYNHIQLYGILQESPIATSIFRGPDFVIGIANDQALRLWGKNKSVIGKKLIDALPELKDQPYMQILENVYKTGQTYFGNENIAYLEYNGEIKPIYVSFIYKALYNPEGEVDGILCMGYDVTEQVETRKEKEISEERFRIAIDSANLDTFDVNLLTGEAICSQRFYDTFGLKGPVIPYEEIIKPIHPADRCIREEALKIAIQTSMLKYEVRINWPDQSIRWINVLGKVFYDENKKPIRLLGTVMDITDQKKFINVLEESEHRLSVAIEAAELGTWEVDLITNNIVYSKRYLQILGYSEDAEPSHNELMEEILPEDLQIRNAAIKEGLKTGVISFEIRLRRKDNKVRWIKVKGKTLYDNNGMPVKLMGTIMDITEQKNSFYSLQKSEERFRMLADSMPQQIWTSDSVGNFNYYNKAVYDYTGLSFEQIQNAGWINMVHPDDREENIIKWMQAVTLEEAFIVEHRLLRHNGEYRWHLSRALPQKDSSGEIQIWVGTSTDIHEIKENETQKDFFISVASHELKTPITSIKGYIQILQSVYNEAKDEFLTTSLNKVDKQVVRLTKLIAELLDLSKIKSGSLQLNKEYFCLNTLIKEIIEEIKLIEPDYKVIFTSENECIVYADKERISQVIVNFLTNAIKYSPNSNVITIKSIVADSSAYVSVIDQGIGISKADQQKVFQRFYRVEGKSEKTFPGFGIGLFIAAEIIQRHEGVIGVNSTLGKGSVFYFTLPL